MTVGVTVAALQQAYGNALELFNEPPGGPQFGVVTPDGDLYGALTDLDRQRDRQDDRERRRLRRRLRTGPAEN